MSLFFEKRRLYENLSFSQHESNTAKFRGAFPINSGGGARLIPREVPCAVKDVVENSSITGGGVTGTISAVIAAGIALAHSIDTNLVNTGELDSNDIYNKYTDIMHM